MKANDADNAHEVSEAFQEAVIQLGIAMLLNLTNEQREYVITKAHDEFRFWRITDRLAELNK